METNKNMQIKTLCFFKFLGKNNNNFKEKTTTILRRVITMIFGSKYIVYIP
jgi:hypothetical protein